MMEFEFSPVEEPKKATEKHVNELNDKIDELSNKVSELEQTLSRAMSTLNDVAYNVRSISRRVHM